MEKKVEDPVPAYRDSRGSHPMVLAWTVAAAVFAAILIAIQLLRWPADQHVDDPVQAIYYLATVFGATVAMIIAVWRGVVANRQAEAAFEQLKLTTQQLDKTERQLQHTARQIAASEETNLADLFERGMSLCEDIAQPKAVSGVAMLRYVGVAPTSPFAGDVKTALSYLLARAELSTASPPAAWFAFKTVSEIALRTGSSVSIAGLKITGVYLDDKLPQLRGVSFKDVTFVRMNTKECLAVCYIEDCDFIDCTISRSRDFIGRIGMKACRIENITAELGTKRKIEFFGCNFSNCVRCDAGASDIFQDCFYFEATPPSKEVLDKIGSHLTMVPGGPGRPTASPLLLHRPSS